MTETPRGLKGKTVSRAYFTSIYTGALDLGVPETVLKPVVKKVNAQDRYPVNSLLSIFQISADYFNDPYIGIRLGAAVRPVKDMHVIYAVTISEDLQSGLELNLHYQPIIQQLGRTLMHKTGNTVQFVFKPAGDDPRIVYFTQALFAGYVNIGKWLLWAQESPVKAIAFKHNRPDDLSAHHRIFGENITFNADVDRLEFNEALLKTKLPSHNPEHLQTVKDRLDIMLADLEKTDDIVARTRILIRQGLGRNAWGALDIADQLGMSERSLRRKLTWHDTSYRELLSDIRKDMAPEFLAKPELTLSEIALSLGFSDQSAFSRVFKQWHNQSPRAFRKAQFASVNA